MSDFQKSPKAIKAEETIDIFLNSSVHTIGSAEEKDAIELMRKLPSGIDEKKLFEALKRMGAIQLFRFAGSFSVEYIHVLRDVMRMVYLNDGLAGKMTNQCLAFALDKDFSEPNVHEEYKQTAAFLQYLDTLLFPIDKPENFKVSDKFITPAVSEYVAQTLVKVRKQSRDTKPFNSFIYVLGKSNHPLAEQAYKFQIGNDNRIHDINIFLMALEPNKMLSNTAKAYQLAYNKLAENQKGSLADEVIKTIGIQTEIGQKWVFKIELSSSPEKKPRNGWFVTIAVSNMWTDCIALDVKGPKGTAKGNERHGVLKGKGLDFLKIDLFNLHANIDEIAQLYGIDKLYWENVNVSVDGLDRKTVKMIKDWVK